MPRTGSSRPPLPVIFLWSVYNGTINDVKKYIQKNKNDKILIVTGYSNASYCFFKILDITNGKYLPTFNQTDYERLKKGKGYCVAFCQKAGQINGKSFKGDVDYTKIMELIQFTLKNKKVLNYIQDNL